MNNTHRIVLSAIVAIAAAPQFAAAHGGIYFHQVNGQAALGWNNPSTGQIDAWPDRVSRSNWNWHAPTGAFSSSSPSWSTKPREGDILGFRVLTSLQKWDDTLGMFVDSAFDARITYTIAGNNYQVITNPANGTAGFQFAMTSSDAPDYWHLRHSLHGVAQDNPDATGVYRLNYEARRTFVTSIDDAVLGTHAAGTTVVYPAFGMLFNRGAATDVYDRAFGYAKTNVVPEPATLAALALGLMGVARRRKSR